MLAARVHTGDVDLLPFDRDIVGLEDGLDGLRYFGADTITCFSTLSYVRRLLGLACICCLERVPGMSVTVYLPPNLVGLKMSAWTVAYAVDRCQWGCWSSIARNTYSGQLSTSWLGIVFERFAAEPGRTDWLVYCNTRCLTALSYLSGPLRASRKHLCGRTQLSRCWVHPEEQQALRREDGPSSIGGRQRNRMNRLWYASNINLTKFA